VPPGVRRKRVRQPHATTNGFVGIRPCCLTFRPILFAPRSMDAGVTSGNQISDQDGALMLVG
jgi:hypothetical protein